MSEQKKYWRFYFLNQKKPQIIPDYQYLIVSNFPKYEYDINSFKTDYLLSDYPKELYYSVRNIEIVKEKI